ncbi:MAG: hypothetical protein NT099_06015 [Candidatus Saganbacteria bacterium]|nr:hypothetical protein [Candidatus Saganbacteria bacterium]
MAPGITGYPNISTSRALFDMLQQTRIDRDGAGKQGTLEAEELSNKKLTISTEAPTSGTTPTALPAGLDSDSDGTVTEKEFASYTKPLYITINGDTFLYQGKGLEAQKRVVPGTTSGSDQIGPAGGTEEAGEGYMVPGSDIPKEVQAEMEQCWQWLFEGKYYGGNLFVNALISSGSKELPDKKEFFKRLLGMDESGTITWTDDTIKIDGEKRQVQRSGFVVREDMGDGTYSYYFLANTTSYKQLFDISGPQIESIRANHCHSGEALESDEGILVPLNSLEAGKPSAMQRDLMHLAMSIQSGMYPKEDFREICTHRTVNYIDVATVMGGGGMTPKEVLEALGYGIDSESRKQWPPKLHKLFDEAEKAAKLDWINNGCREGVLPALTGQWLMALVLREFSKSATPPGKEDALDDIDFKKTGVWAKLLYGGRDSILSQSIQYTFVLSATDKESLEEFSTDPPKRIWLPKGTEHPKGVKVEEYDPKEMKKVPIKTGQTPEGHIAPAAK